MITHTLFLQALLVASGAALGGLARYWLALGIDSRLPGAFPYGTLVVNVSGAMLMGVLVGWLGMMSWPPPTQWPWWPLLGVGFAGSYTTVSSFSLQVLVLYRSTRLRLACAYIALSMMLCPSALLAGWLLLGGVR